MTTKHKFDFTHRAAPSLSVEENRAIRRIILDLYSGVLTTSQPRQAIAQDESRAQRPVLSTRRKLRRTL